MDGIDTIRKLRNTTKTPAVFVSRRPSAMAMGRLGLTHPYTKYHQTHSR
jgi:hypothetical protein